jgi:hypothetical protein
MILHFTHPHQNIISSHKTDVIQWKQKTAGSFMAYYITHVHIMYYCLTICCHGNLRLSLHLTLTNPFLYISKEINIMSHSLDLWSSESVGLSSNASDLYLRDTWFESHTSHWQSWLKIFVGSLSSLLTNYGMALQIRWQFHILSNSTFNRYAIIWCYTA